MIKINRDDLILINDLVQVSTAIKQIRIKKYILQLSKEENAIIVEKYQDAGKFGVLLRKELTGIKKDEIIPIVDAEKLGKYLTQIADDDVVEITTRSNVVYLKTAKDKLKLPYYEETDKDLESRNKLGKAFETKKYGDENNKLTFYERADPENPEPDAVCKIDLSKMKLKNMTEIFDINHVALIAKDNKLTISAKEKVITEIERTIEKGEKDAMSVTGECEILLQDIDCINMLAKFDDTTIIEMKDTFPVVLRKKLPKSRIGINYLVSIMESIEEELEEE